MTREQFMAIANSFPQKWCIIEYRICRCFVAPLEGLDPVVVRIRYGRLEPIQGTAYDTKEEARAALLKKRELRRKQEAAAIQIVAKYLRRIRWEVNRAAEKDKDLKLLLDAAADYINRKRIDANECRIEMLRGYIRTGMINMSGLSFRKEDVMLVRYGQPTVSYWMSTTPIELTLNSGEKVTTRTRDESSFLQDIFHKNGTTRIWPSVKWPDGTNIDED